MGHGRICHLKIPSKICKYWASRHDPLLSTFDLDSILLSLSCHHINSLTFLKFSHRLQLHVPKRWHQTAPKLEPSFSLHDSTSGTSETQRRPSAGLANSSCHRSFRILELQFFSPHFWWINLERNIYIIQTLPKPAQMMMREVHVMFELGLHYAGDLTTNCISPPRFWFWFDMGPSLQVDRDGHQKRMIWWNIASKIWIPKKHLTHPNDCFTSDDCVSEIQSLAEIQPIDLSRKTFCDLEIPQHRTSGLKGNVKSFIFVLSRRADPTLNHQSAVDMGTPCTLEVAPKSLNAQFVGWVWWNYLSS